MKMLSGIALIVLAFGLLVVGLYYAAKLKTHVTNVRTGRMELVVAGETLVKVLSNLPGHHAKRQTDGTWKIVPNIVDGEGNVIEDGHRAGPLGYLERKWGIYWVSLWYPLRQVLKFNLPFADRLVSESKLNADYKVKDRIEHVVSKPVEDLLWQFPHPVFVPEVELGEDGAKADFVVNAILQIEDPGQAVLVHDAKFFLTINQVIQGVVGDFGTKLTYQKLRATRKGLGKNNQPSTDPTLASIAQLAIEANDQPSPDDESRSVREVTGVKIINAWVVDFNLTGASLELQNAAQQMEIQKNLAAAAKERGKGAADEINAKAKAEADRIDIIAEAMRKNGASGDAIAAVIGTILRTENIGKMTGLSTYMEGGGTGMVAVTSTPRTTPPPVVPPAPPSNP